MNEIKSSNTTDVVCPSIAFIGTIAELIAYLNELSSKAVAV